MPLDPGRIIRIIRATNSLVPDLQAGDDLVGVGASMHHRRKHFEMLWCNKQNATENTNVETNEKERDPITSIRGCVYIFVSTERSFRKVHIFESFKIRNWIRD